MSIYTDKVVWVTGASSGIGAELVRQFYNLGAKVVMSARNVDKMQAIVNQFDNPEKCLIVELDLEQTDNIQTNVKEVVEKFNRIDFLINNGGLSQRGEASKTSLDIDRKIMEINYFGAVALTKAVLPIMQKQQSGHIVAISSIAGKFGFYLRSAYSASKHALQGFYESLLLEEEKNGIKVTIAYPGKINTDISVSALNADGNAHGKMDHNQATGMPVEECVRKLIKAIEKNKKSVLIGNKEIKAVTLKRFFPKLFWKVIRKQSPT